MRLSKSEAERVKQGLIMSLNADFYKHPETLPNEFEGIWINDQQKRAYLRRLADKGLIVAKWHERGWYKWYTYKLSADWLPF
jgi:hypothetical protein